jgi:hypothetical protein
MPRNANPCRHEPTPRARRAPQTSVRSLRNSSASGARSPSGALLRHSPGRTHPPLAQLQFPRFLRSDLAGVTRFDLSQVYRAPRRPVLVLAERPGAARERMANRLPAICVRKRDQQLSDRPDRGFTVGFTDRVHALPRSSLAIAAKAILSVRAR